MALFCLFLFVCLFVLRHGLSVVLESILELALVDQAPGWSRTQGDLPTSAY